MRFRSNLSLFTKYLEAFISFHLFVISDLISVISLRPVYTSLSTIHSLHLPPPHGPAHSYFPFPLPIRLSPAPRSPSYPLTLQNSLTTYIVFFFIFIIRGLSIFCTTVALKYTYFTPSDFLGKWGLVRPSPPPVTAFRAATFPVSHIQDG